MASVKSLRDMHKLKLENSVQIKRAGSHYKARFRGAANFCFGQTPPEARERLLKTQAMRDTPLAFRRREQWAKYFKEGLSCPPKWSNYLKA